MSTDNTLSLFTALMTARDPAVIDAAINRYGQSLNIRWVSVGGRDNNQGQILVNTRAELSLYELVANGDDAMIEYLQATNWFQHDPETPMEALEEIAQRVYGRLTSLEGLRLVEETLPALYSELVERKSYDALIAAIPTDIPEAVRREVIYHYQHKSKSSADKSPPFNYLLANKIERDKKNRKLGLGKNILTFTAIDYGIGQTDLPSTILSLSASNKMKNPLVGGMFNMGGSTIHAFTQRGVIASISYTNTNQITFTVVRSFREPDTKADSWKYLVVEGDDGKVECPTVTVDSLEKLEGITIVRPHVAAKNLNNYGTDCIILPPHGTVRRQIDVKISDSSHVRVYEFLRNQHFNRPTPIYFATDQTKDKGSYPKTIGVGRKMNESRYLTYREDNYTRLYTSPVRSLSLGEFGPVDVQIWVDEGYKTDDGKPKESVNRLWDINHPLIVTLNGQTHARLPLTGILNAANLPMLDKKVIIHVNADTMDPLARRDAFLSSRENTTAVFRDSLTKALMPLLRDNNDLRVIHARIMAATGNKSSFQMDDLNRILRLNGVPSRLNKGVESRNASTRIAKKIGIEKLLAGGGTEEGSRGAGSGLSDTGGGDHKGSGQYIEMERDPPSRAKVVKRVVHVGTNYVTVRTDAMKSVYDGKIFLVFPEIVQELPTGETVTFPSFLSVSGPATPLDKFETIFPVECASHVTINGKKYPVAIDSDAEVYVEIKNAAGEVVLMSEPQWLTVIDPNAKRPRDENTDTRPEAKVKTGGGEVNNGKKVLYEPEITEIKVDRYLIDGPSAEDWNKLLPGDSDPEMVAFRHVYSEADGILSVFINTHFKYLDTIEREIKQIKGVKWRRDQYYDMVCAAAVKMTESYGNDIPAGLEDAAYHTLKADMMFMSLWSVYEAKRLQVDGYQTADSAAKAFVGDVLGEAFGD